MQGGIGGRAELQVGTVQWYLLVEGSGSCDGRNDLTQLELGYIPFAVANTHTFRAVTDCSFISITRERNEYFMVAVPQFNYLLRKYRIAQHRNAADWLLGLG